MTITPDVGHIDVMLMEYAALCYQRSLGKCQAEEVDNYRRKIVEQVQLIRNHNHHKETDQ